MGFWTVYFGIYGAGHAVVVQVPLVFPAIEGPAVKFDDIEGPPSTFDTIDGPPERDFPDLHGR